MDPIADFLAQIKNAYAAHRPHLITSHSRIKQELAQILKRTGFIGEVTTSGRELKLELRYHGKLPLLTHLKRISRPSVRRYAPADQIPYALGGRGVTILSTSQGLLTDKEARQKGIGGEIICQVW